MSTTVPFINNLSSTSSAPPHAHSHDGGAAHTHDHDHGLAEHGHTHEHLDNAGMLSSPVAYYSPFAGNITAHEFNRPAWLHALTVYVQESTLSAICRIIQTGISKREVSPSESEGKN